MDEELDPAAGDSARHPGDGEDDRSRRWVDPFALPAGMTFHFILLVTSVFATSAFYVWFLAPPGLAKLSSSLTRCAASTGISGALQLARESIAEVPYLNAVHARYARCLEPVDRTRTWWVLGSLIVLIAAAGVAYWLIPWWKIRRGRLVPLPAAVTEQAAALRAELNTQVAAAGLARAPIFLLDPVSPAIGGLAFGRFGRYYVRLDAGLVVLLSTDPAGFRAVVRHELAHLRNRDVDQTYLTVALWRAFLLIILLPVAAAFLEPVLVHNPLGTGVRQAVQLTLGSLGGFWVPMLGLAAMVYLIRNAVLRSRELFADLRAAEPQAGQDLARLLRSAALGGRGGLAGGLRDRLGTHPAAAVRNAAVADPGRLFRFGFWEAAAAGVALSVSYALLALILSASAVPVRDAVGAPLLVLAIIIGGLLTLALWRGTTYALLNRWPPPGVSRPAAGLAAGLIVGAALTKSTAHETVPVVAATSLTLAVLAGWIVGLAAAWLPVLRGRSLRWAWPAAAAAASVLIAAVFELWLPLDGLRYAYSLISQLESGLYARAGSIGWTGPHWLWNAAFLPSYLGPAVIRLSFAALLLLWAVPLAAWTRAAPVIGPGWLRRALPRERDPAPLPPDIVRIGPAVAAGAVAGGVACVAQFALRAVLHAGLPIAVRRTDVLGLLISYWELGIAVAAQVIVAGFVAATARRHGVLLGMLAASVTAGLAVLGAVVSARVGSCVTVFTVRPESCQLHVMGAYVSLVLQLTVLDGGAAALLAALSVAGARAVLRRRAARRPARQAAEPVPRPRPVLSRRFRSAATAGVAAILAAAVITAWPNPGSGPGSAAATALFSPVRSGPAVRTWWHVGGQDRVGALVRDEGTLVEAASQSSGTALRSACAILRRDAGKAIGFAPVPDAKIQPEWSRATASFHRGAADCLATLSGAGSSAASRSGREMLNGAKALDQARARIRAVMKAR